MPAIKTEITEIVTGLGMLSFDSLEDALCARPAELVNVTSDHWARLLCAHHSGEFERELGMAWDNGRYFLNSRDGLRGRRPVQIEWKGPHNPPGYDFLPADLRIDHVYLVSCKYLSQVLANVSPAHLFERVLADRTRRSPSDWFLKVAESPYRTFYSKVRNDLFTRRELPENLEDLGSDDRDFIGNSYPRKWPDQLHREYVLFAREVSRITARIWSQAVPTAQDKELLFWRMLRLNPAPYFILGSAGNSSIRLRVGTPWDWRKRYVLKEFLASAPEAAQPRVSWEAKILDKDGSKEIVVHGHVEIRWSHGRFCGYPEAKIYLDSKHSEVPGYFELS